MRYALCAYERPNSLGSSLPAGRRTLKAKGSYGDGPHATTSPSFQPSPHTDQLEIHPDKRRTRASLSVKGDMNEQRRSRMPHIDKVHAATEQQMVLKESRGRRKECVPRKIPPQYQP